jgi:hypothetical protein
MLELHGILTKKWRAYYWYGNTDGVVGGHFCCCSRKWIDWGM